MANTMVKATKTLGLNFAGVDVMPNSDGKNITVIEINSFPGFPKVRRFNIAEYMIKEIARRKWR